MLCVSWNVYHILAAPNSAPHLKPLDHIIKKPPADVSARMLAQQSKKESTQHRKYTPDLWSFLFNMRFEAAPY